MLDAQLLPFRTTRAVLRAMEQADAAAYAAGTKDPLVRRFGHLPEPEYTESSVRSLIDGPIDEGLRSGDLAVLTIADPGTDEFAGSLVLFDVTDSSVEVGFWIHPDHRGEGLAGAARGPAVDFARRSGFTTVTARTVPENVGSQRALAGAGFVAGDTVSEATPAGEEVTLLRYERKVGPAGE